MCISYLFRVHQSWHTLVLELGQPIPHQMALFLEAFVQVSREGAPKNPLNDYHAVMLEERGLFGAQPR